MTEDSGAQPDTDDLPDAREAFTSEEPARRATTPYSISRAAALLSVIRPAIWAPDDYLADAEPRELLGVVPVESFRVERGESAAILEGLGVVGSRAAEVLRVSVEGRYREDLRTFAANLAREIDVSL